MKIIYFHGFGSTGNSAKTRSLKAMFGNDTVWCPDLPVSPSDVVELVDSFITNHTDDRIIFVGTSLGGFYANYFAQLYHVPAVLINPSTEPHITIEHRIGQQFFNYVTNKPFQVTLADAAYYAEMYTTVSKIQKGLLIHLFLASDDAILDPTVAKKNMPFTCSLTETVDGGHRFTQHWDLVISKISSIVDY
jgi:hypothetical protein